MVWSGRTLAAVGLVAVGLCALGWAFGLPELSALAVAGWLALGAAALHLARRHRAPEVALSAHPSRVARGQAAELRIRVGNPSADGSGGRRAASGHRTAAVRLHGRLATAGEGILAVTPLAAGESTEVVVTLPTPRRGVLTAGPLWATTTDPLGWWRRQEPTHSTATLLVRPTVHPLPSTAVGAGPLRSPRGSRGIGQGGSVDDELVGLRPYVRGDDLRLIHWRTSARRNHPHVVQVEPPAQAPAVAVVLDTSSGACTAEAFERAVEAAASVLDRTAADLHRVRLLTSDGWDSGRTDPAGATDLLDALARVELRIGGDLRGTLDTALNDDGDGGVVLCTGDAGALSASSPTDLAMAGPGRDDLTVVFTAESAPPGPSRAHGRVVHWDGSAPLADAWGRGVGGTGA